MDEQQQETQAPQVEIVPPQETPQQPNPISEPQQQGNEGDITPPVVIKPVEVKKTESNAGRPTVMTPETLGKLQNAFLMGFTDREACIYAGIHVDSLYAHQKANPEYSDQKEAWKENPVLKARATLYKSLENAKHAKWYLERKHRKEFATRQEITGADGEPIRAQIEYVNPTTELQPKPEPTQGNVEADNQAASSMATTGEPQGN